MDMGWGLPLGPGLEELDGLRPPSAMQLLMGVQALQPATVDLLLEMVVKCSCNGKDLAQLANETRAALAMHAAATRDAALQNIPDHRPPPDALLASPSPSPALPKAAKERRLADGSGGGRTRGGQASRGESQAGGGWGQAPQRVGGELNGVDDRTGAGSARCVRSDSRLDPPSASFSSSSSSVAPPVALPVPAPQASVPAAAVLSMGRPAEVVTPAEFPTASEVPSSSEVEAWYARTEAEGSGADNTVPQAAPQPTYSGGVRGAGPTEGGGGGGEGAAEGGVEGAEEGAGGTGRKGEAAEGVARELRKRAKVDREGDGREETGDDDPEGNNANGEREGDGTVGDGNLEEDEDGTDGSCCNAEGPESKRAKTGAASGAASGVASGVASERAGGGSKWEPGEAGEVLDAVVRTLHDVDMYVAMSPLDPICKGQSAAKLTLLLQV